MSPVTRSRVFGMLCFTIGGACLIIGICWLVPNLRLAATGTAVEGRITGFREIVQSRRNHVAIHPVAAYEVEGKVYQAETPAHTDPPRFKTGDPVKILVPPGDPAGGKFAGFVDLWLGPLVLTVLGLVLSGVGWWGWNHRVGGASRAVC
ncbi:DUF3592 domain-containing protein [Luteolibacter ambystomatis]|uniref:DUF3592 domain-containing protein n=1 Tax=Luteolibacter ambystomatis TaxID=2824561 RepID=A0A975IYR2_9BACT|nr:DUF3592 domain-containing protein [Luteolibacter ambystomatis]QUE50143.1 DUF3592 domain-containing protein [Luteolibacter ambystomatis]